MENKIIDKFHDQRDYYIMMELVKKLKEDIDSNYGIYKMCAIQAKREIKKHFGSFDGK